MVKHVFSLRGYGAPVSDFTAPPLIVKRVEPDFVAGLWEDLRSGRMPGQLSQPEEADGHLRLYQPIHRVFNVVLLELVCQRPGSPRVDPRAIESAGFVLRRVNHLRQPETDEAWQSRAGQVLGWAKPDLPHLDPDPARRRGLLQFSNAGLHAKLSEHYAARQPPGESVTPLFLAPPEVCEAAERTLLFGVVPVTSQEEPSQPEPVTLDLDTVKATMPSFLLALAGDGRPQVGADTIKLDAVNQALATDPTQPLSRFLDELRLLHFGWRLFDSTEGAAIRSLLRGISLRFATSPRPLDAFLQDCVQVLVLRTAANTAITLPTQWPRPSAALADQIAGAVKTSLEARSREVRPKERRFDHPTALYRLHAFVRARGTPTCPPDLCWATPSRPFAIVPWWESGGAPLHTIALPDLDAQSVKKFRPNVAFSLPPKLAALLSRNKPEDFLAGRAKEASGASLGWVCSFSIPVITLCAFIVLNIFLALLHIVFQWLFYIKVCLPLPKRSSSTS